MADEGLWLDTLKKALDSLDLFGSITENHFDAAVDAAQEKLMAGEFELIGAKRVQEEVLAA